MVKINKSRFLRYTDGKSLVRAELFADTADELPDADGGLDGIVLAQGSTAHVINDSDVYSLNSSGEWIKQGG